MFINDHVYISERDGDTDTEKGCQNLLYSRRLLMIVTLSPFPGGPGLAGTRMSPFWILLELRVMGVMVATGAIGHAKFPQNVATNKPTSSFLFYRPDALPVAQPTVSEN